MILQPQAYFTVVRQIANHTDAGTYYVRAVIRNAFTDAILDTLDLTDKGSQRFKKDWMVPGDTSGQGFYISIVTSVYSDSGYTTKSENYGDEESTYLVQERVLLRGGGGGVDAYTIRQIVKDELGKLPKHEKMKIPKPKEYEMRWDEVLDAIRGIKVPEPEKLDLSPVISRLNEAMKAIQDKPITPETDLSALSAKLDKIISALPELYTNLSRLMDATQAEITKGVLADLERIVKDIEFSIAPSTAKLNAPRPEEQGQPLDLKQLAL